MPAPNAIYLDAMAVIAKDPAIPHTASRLVPAEAELAAEDIQARTVLHAIDAIPAEAWHRLGYHTRQILLLANAAARHHTPTEQRPGRRDEEDRTEGLDSDR